MCVPGCVGEVDPEADLDLVAPHGGENHGGVEEVLRRHLRVVAVVERRLQRQELAADQVVRLARAVQPPPGDRPGVAAAASAGHGLRDAGLGEVTWSTLRQLRALVMLLFLVELLLWFSNSAVTTALNMRLP